MFCLSVSSPGADPGNVPPLEVLVVTKEKIIFEVRGAGRRSASIPLEADGYNRNRIDRKSSLLPSDLISINSAIRPRVIRRAIVILAD